MKHAFYGLLTATLLLGYSLANAQEYTLKFNIKEGDTFRYKATMELDFGGQPVFVNFSLTNKVLKVEEGGNIQIESAPSEAVVKFGDQEILQPGPPPLKITLSPKGEVVKVEGEGSSPLSRAGWVAAMGRPLKVGDKWSTTYKVGESELKDEYEFVGVEKVGDVEVARIKFTTRPAKEGAEGLSLDGSSWVDLKTGMMFRMDVRFKGLQIDPSFPPFDGTWKIEQVREAAAPQG